jgi:hypothetical protein
MVNLSAPTLVKFYDGSLGAELFSATVSLLLPYL